MGDVELAKTFVEDYHRLKNEIHKIIVGQDDVVEEGRSNGADDYLVKPFTAEILVERIDNLFA